MTIIYIFIIINYYNSYLLKILRSIYNKVNTQTYIYLLYYIIFMILLI